jgi:hypothetical protein
MLRASKSFRFRFYRDKARPWPPKGEGPKACPLYPSEADIGAVFSHVSFAPTADSKRWPIGDIIRLPHRQARARLAER